MLAKVVSGVLWIVLLGGMALFAYSNISLPGVMRRVEVEQFSTAKLGEPYKDFEYTDLNGSPFRLSSLKGKVILIEPIGMSCPACQALSGGNTVGGVFGAQPQSDLRDISRLLGEYGDGVSLSDPDLVFAQIIFYGPTMAEATLVEARQWADHFKLTGKPNTYVLIAPRRYQGPVAYNLIPGFQLVDKDFVLRSDSTGHHPRENLYRTLLPMVRGLLRG